VTQPLTLEDYERIQQALEAELRRIEALEKAQTLIKAMQAWLNGDDDTTPPDDGGTAA
jgi:hypothetical protein